MVEFSTFTARTKVPITIVLGSNRLINAFKLSSLHGCEPNYLIDRLQVHMAW